jgi:hypothetical protein
MTAKYVITGTINVKNLFKYHGLCSAAFELMDKSKTGIVENTFTGKKDEM